jgi:hypothetical protein
MNYFCLAHGVPMIAVLYLSTLLFPLMLPARADIDKLLRAQVAIVPFVSAYMAEVVRAEPARYTSRLSAPFFQRINPTPSDVCGQIHFRGGCPARNHSACSLKVIQPIAWLIRRAASSWLRSGEAVRMALTPAW